MKTFNSCLLNCAEDKFLRVDEKYYSALHDGKFNLFRTDNNVNLSDILEEDYCLCPYADDVKYKGIPTGQSYVDEDGEIIDYQIVTKDNHPGRLKYTVNQNNILLSSLRLAKSPALNFTYDKLDEYVFSNGYYIFRVKTGWDKRFVLYLLRSKKLKTLLDENIYRGIGISSYRLEDLFKIEVKKLTIEEQQNAFTMRIRLKDYNPKFAYYYMRSAYFQYLVEIYKKGLGNNTNIFPIVVREFPLIDIPIVEQQRIVDEIQAEIDMQNEIKNQSAILRTEIDKIIESAAGVSEN